MNFNLANTIAHKYHRLLGNHCNKIYIAGSLRRLKTDVKDIEIVCLPRTETLDAVDLFGTGKQIEHVIDAFADCANNLGKVIKGQPSGKYMQILLPEGINLDLFIPSAADFYRQLAIRTGPAEYSYATLAIGWRKLGWCGTQNHGLRKMTDCQAQVQCSGKTIWHCTNTNGELPPVWQSEHEFFDWINVPWQEPQHRM